jgi:uncharacterized repeat protein (TIGR01451 family)
MARLPRTLAWRLALALILLLSLAAPMARDSIAAGLTQTNDRVLCPANGDSPDETGPRDRFDRLMRCVSGSPIVYGPNDPIPPSKPVLAGGGPVDNRTTTNLFAPPVQIDGQFPDQTISWDWIGSVGMFANGDIAYTTAQDPTYGDNFLKVVRPVKHENAPPTFTVLYQNGLVFGTHLGGLDIGDFDGDGKEDVAIVASDDPGMQDIGFRGNLNIFWGEDNNHSAFTRVSVDVGNTPYAIASAAISGGRRAIGVQNWNSNVFALNRTTTGRTLSQTNFPGQTNQAGWDKGTYGDVNYDGHDDITIGMGQYARLHRFFLGDGNGNFTEGASFGKPANATTYDPYSIEALRLVDVTKDNRQDMLVATGGNYNPDIHQWGSRIWQYDQVANPQPGQPTFNVLPTMYVADDIPSSLDVTQINCEDDVPDLWVFSDGWERSAYMKGNANGGFSPYLYLEPNGLYANGTLLNDVLMTDLNGDGWKDEVASYDYNGLNYRLHRPCVTITKTAPASVKLGDSFEYSISVMNSGPKPTFGMVISDVLPLGIINPIASSGTITGGRNYTSAPFDLASGQSKTVTIRVTTTKFGTLVNNAIACSKGACTLPSTATTVVQDVTPTVSFVESQTYVNEGSPSAVLTVRLSEAVAHDVTVGVRLYGGTANTLDVRLSTPTVTILKGFTETQAVVAIEEDTLVEGEEYTNVQLTGPSGANLAVPAVEVVHILDNDTNGAPPNVVNFSSANYSASLNSNLVTATLVLDRPADQAMSVNVLAYADPVNMTTGIGNTWVSFDKGQQMKQFTIDLGTDKTPNVTLKISSAVNTNIVVLGPVWKATVHRAAVETAPTRIYLPVVTNMQP